MDTLNDRASNDEVYEESGRINKRTWSSRFSEALWINSTYRVSGIHETMTALTGANFRSTCRNVKKQDKKRQRYIATIKWFGINNSLKMRYPELRSLSMDIVATKENKINCDEAKVGASIQTKLDGVEILTSTRKRRDQIRTLTCLQASVKIGDKLCTVFLSSID